jgi:hypothetical protein
MDCCQLQLLDILQFLECRRGVYLVEYVQLLLTPQPLLTRERQAHVYIRFDCVVVFELFWSSCSILHFRADLFKDCEPMTRARSFQRV